MRILFKESWAIDNPETKNRKPDPVISILPEKDSIIYVAQKDTTFGRSVSKITYRVDNISLSMENTTRLFYNLVPVVGPGNLKIDIAVIPFDDEILFYGTIRIKTVNLSFLEEKIRLSIENRLIALYNWFAASVDAPPATKIARDN